MPIVDKFPVTIPVCRDFPPETGAIVTAAPANQSGFRPGRVHTRQSLHIEIPSAIGAAIDAEKLKKNMPIAGALKKPNGCRLSSVLELL